MTRVRLSHMSLRIDDGSTILELGEDMALSLILRGRVAEDMALFFSLLYPQGKYPSHPILHFTFTLHPSV
jgi:hypothetical protein